VDLIGDMIKVSDTAGSTVGTGADAREPSVAYDQEHDQYLVVWKADTRVNGQDEVFGQLVDRNGNKVGGEILIATSSSTSEDARKPDVAYNATEDEYLVVWKKIVAGTTADDVYGQRVSHDGALVGSEIAISQLDTDRGATTPVVAYNNGENEFVVAWDSNNGADMIKRIYGQRLIYSGGSLIESGSDFQISDLSGASTSEEPDVAYNSVSNQYLVTWKGKFSAGGTHSGFRFGPIGPPFRREVAHEPKSAACVVYRLTIVRKTPDWRFAL